MWENVRFSMNSTMPLFFVMLLGYVLYQKKFLSDAFVAGANKFVFYVALPVQLFRDLAATDVRAAFDGAYVLFCFVVTLVSILGIWALAKLFLPDKRLVGEFVQVCYRSSAAILGTAFLQSIYGTAEMSSMMILGSVPLYNVEGTAGLVPLFLDKASRQPVDYIHIPNLPKCDGAIYVVGDSMYPLLKSGDIVLFHNDSQYILDALPAVLKYYAENGYSVVPISEILLTGETTIDIQGRQQPVSTKIPEV